MFNILIDVRWGLSVVLLCISLMTYVAEHLFMFSFAIWASLAKCLFKVLPFYRLGHAFSFHMFFIEFGSKAFIGYAQLISRSLAGPLILSAVAFRERSLKFG